MSVSTDQGTPAEAGGNPFDQILPDEAAAPQSAAPATDPAPADDAEPGEEALGDPGKQALERMKAKLKAARERIAALESASPAGEDDAARIQREAEAAANAKANARIVKAEIRAAAAGKLSDPTDALTFIDSSQFEVDEDGDVDQAEIADAIADLIRRKPYLAAQGGASTTPKPDRSQGAAPAGASTTAQRFAADLERMGF